MTWILSGSKVSMSGDLRFHRLIFIIAAQSADILSPSVSVVVLMYNSASTLGDCLESIKNQDYRGEVEIILDYMRKCESYI